MVVINRTLCTNEIGYQGENTKFIIWMRKKYISSHTFPDSWLLQRTIIHWDDITFTVVTSIVGFTHEPLSAWMGAKIVRLKTFKITYIASGIMFNISCTSMSIVQYLITLLYHTINKSVQHILWDSGSKACMIMLYT